MEKSKRGKKRGQEARNPFVSAQGEPTRDDIVGSSSQIGSSTDTVYNVQSRIETEWVALREQMKQAAPYIEETFRTG